MNLIEAFERWEIIGKIYINDIKHLDFLSKITLANTWGIKWNIFSLTNDLLYEAYKRNKNLEDLDFEEKLFFNT